MAVANLLLKIIGVQCIKDRTKYRESSPQLISSVPEIKLLGVKDGVGELLISFIILASSASFRSQLLILLAISAFVIVTVVGDLGGFGDDSVLNCLINKGGEHPSNSCFLWVNDIIHGEEYGDKEIKLFSVWFNGDVGDGDGNLGLGDGNLCLGITGL
nr:hypothetical protein [Tanacetum cinerariifolium]